MRTYMSMILIMLVCMVMAGDAETRILQDWVALFDGDMSTDDFAYAIAVGPSGNVYITGHVNDFDTITSGMESAMTVAYDTDGSLLWSAGLTEAFTHSREIAVDKDDNVYIITSLGLIKYNRFGVEQWRSMRWEDYHLAEMTVDEHGYIYVAGVTGDYRTSDFITVKYNSDGMVIWERTYSATSTSADRPYAMIVDDIGNVYISGITLETGGDSDIATIAYDRFGHRIWHEWFDGPASAKDRPSSMIIDGPRIYVVGSSNDDYVTIAYDTAGIFLWSRFYDGPDSGHDAANGVTVDPVGNIYVTGSSRGSDYAYVTTISYDEYGSQRWIEQIDAWGGGGIVCDRAHDIIYVCGESRDSESDVMILTYSLSGILISTKYYGYAMGRRDYPADMKIDTDGNLYITGSSYTDYDAKMDFLTLKYTYYADPVPTKNWPKKILTVKK